MTSSASTARPGAAAGEDEATCGGCTLERLTHMPTEELEQHLVSKFIPPHARWANPHSQPTFIITFGPPGSGKHAIATHTHTYLSSSSTNPSGGDGVGSDGTGEYRGENGDGNGGTAAWDIRNTVHIVIDEMVQAVPGYLSEREHCSTHEDSQSLYWGVRKAKSQGGLGLDDLSDHILNTALSKRLDVVWETTGLKVAWTLREIKRIRSMGYRIMLVYPYATDTQLIHRVTDRASHTGQEPPPHDLVLRTSKHAARHALFLIAHVDRMLIWDNTGPKDHPKILIDLSAYGHASGDPPPAGDVGDGGDGSTQEGSHDELAAEVTRAARKGEKRRTGLDLRVNACDCQHVYGCTTASDDGGVVDGTGGALCKDEEPARILRPYFQRLCHDRCHNHDRQAIAVH